jgi:hypothetical protein
VRDDRQRRRRARLDHHGPAVESDAGHSGRARAEVDLIDVHREPPPRELRPLPLRYVDGQRPDLERAVHHRRSRGPQARSEVGVDAAREGAPAERRYVHVGTVERHVVEP